ncbi:MAG TPA: ABC transporter substrate-binding protein [Solirubrobacterales bacterium]
MKIARLILLFVIAAVLLSGCGAEGGEETAATTERPPEARRDVSVTVDSYDGAPVAGLLMAEERGYFAGLGLEPTITTALSPGRPIRYVAEGSIQLGVTRLPQVVLAREKGVPVVAVGSLVPRPTAALIWLEKSKLRGVADLKGKTIAIPGVPFQREFLSVVLQRAGLKPEDVKIEATGYELVPSLVSGRADAIFGGSGNVEGAALEARGLEVVVTPAEELGLPSYDELVVVAHEDLAAEDPELIRDFMSAVARGVAAAVEDPEATVRAIDESGEAGPGRSRKTTEAEVEATLPLLSESGQMDTDQASELIAWMREQGLIERKQPVSELLTNDFLRPQP